jgi:hypothetical protein
MTPDTSLPHRLEEARHNGYIVGILDLNEPEFNAWSKVAEHLDFPLVVVTPGLSGTIVTALVRDDAPDRKRRAKELLKAANSAVGGLSGARVHQLSDSVSDGMTVAPLTPQQAHTVASLLARTTGVIFPFEFEVLKDGVPWQP